MEARGGWRSRPPGADGPDPEAFRLLTSVSSRFAFGGSSSAAAASKKAAACSCPNSIAVAYAVLPERSRLLSLSYRQTSRARIPDKKCVRKESIIIFFYREIYEERLVAGDKNPQSTQQTPPGKHSIESAFRLHCSRWNKNKMTPDNNLTRTEKVKNLTKGPARCS